MLCDNCGKREANVKYSENINGRKKEMHLCEECSEKLGIGKMDFSMPIDFSSFFGGLLEDFETNDFMPLFDEVKTLKCDNCGYNFEDIVNTGKLGKIMDNNIEKKINDNNKEKNTNQKEISKIDKLQEDLKQAIKEERYEDAAKIRDEIKELEDKK